MLLMGKLTISMAMFNSFFYDPWVEKSLASGPGATPVYAIPEEE